MSFSYLAATANFSTILDFVRLAITRANQSNLYYGHGTDNAWDDGMALVLGSLSLPFDVEPNFLSARLSDDEKMHLCEQLERRIEQRIPVPYLINKSFFCGLEFFVDERVLIPRSPIAELIERQFTPWIDAFKVSRILDLCTGSGCIAMACNYAFPGAIVDAIDISSDALDVAKINRQRHGLEGSLNLIQSDCFASKALESYDIIVSNPPYVGCEEMQTLPIEYTHEPKLALETEKNGLAIVENILREAHAYLREGGILVVEVGNSEEALIAAYPQVPFTWLEFERGGEGVFVLTREQLLEINT